MPVANILSCPGPGRGIALVSHNGPASEATLFWPATPDIRTTDPQLTHQKGTHGFFKPRGPQRYLTPPLIGIIARFSTP